MDRDTLYARLERAVTDGASLADALSAVDAVRDGLPVADALRRVEHRGALTFGLDDDDHTDTDTDDGSDAPTPTVHSVAFDRVMVWTWLDDASDAVPGF